MGEGRERFRMSRLYAIFAELGWAWFAVVAVAAGVVIARRKKGGQS